jgi:hypothetical protein
MNNEYLSDDVLDKIIIASRRPNLTTTAERVQQVVIESIGYNLSPTVTISVVRRVPGTQEFTDEAIRELIALWEQHVTRGTNYEITNFVMDRNQNNKLVAVPLNLSTITENIKEATGNRFLTVDGVLLADDPKYGICDFSRHKSAGLSSYLQEKFQFNWSKGQGMVSTSELLAGLERISPKFDAVEFLPHEPMIPGIYYSCETPPVGDGSHLKWLIDRFNPETTADRELIKAAFLTAFWGGPPGRRPVFVITSEDGRGSGKTTVAAMVAHLCGGMIDFSANEDIARIKTRLLSPGGAAKRIALVDNVKSLKFSWAELEAMITSQTISGHRMFVGEGQRPNLLTWFITLNGVSMATDMAMRSVIIKVLKATYEGSWYEETIAYIDEHRNAIIGDILAELRKTPVTLDKFTRWATWEKEILSRLDNPSELQQVILERQGEADAELDEAEIIEQYFAQQLEAHGYDPNTVQVRIPTDLAAQWFSAAIGENVKTTTVGKRLSQMAKERQLKCLTPSKSHKHGRSFIWTGPSADVTGDTINNDLLHSQRTFLTA